MPPATENQSDREALFAEATLTCEHAQRVEVVGEWMPVAHEGAVDKVYAIADGRARLWLDGDRYDLRGGQALFIPAGTVQQGETDADAPLFKTYIHFSSLTSNSLHLLRFFPPPVRLGGAAAAEVQTLCAVLLAEWDGRRPGRQLAVKALLMRVLLAAYRAPSRDLLPADRPRDLPTPRRGQSDAHYDTVRRAMSVITRRLDEPLTLADLAAEVSLSPSHFNRLFSRLVGMPPMRFLETRRMRRAQELLAMTEAPVAQVAEQVGYGDPNYFSRAFQRFIGRPPTEYRAAVRPIGTPRRRARKSR